MNRFTSALVFVFAVLIFEGFICSCGVKRSDDGAIVREPVVMMQRTTPTGFSVKDFNPFVNFVDLNEDTLYLEVEIPDDIFEGILIPDDGYFRFSFRLKNNGSEERRFYYKIIYQNESYKFQEVVMTANGVQYNQDASGNFYGSWEGIHDSLRLTPLIPNDGNYHVQTDSFRIVGNPRNESRYSGRSPDMMYPTREKIERLKKAIWNTPEWIEAVEQKAIANKHTVEDQVFKDALWIINRQMEEGDHISRWKRNPRAGSYRFVLVVFPVEKVNEMPANLRNIGTMQDDTIFVNPFYTLFYDPDELSESLGIYTSSQGLKAAIRFDLSSGIYVDPLKNTNMYSDSSYFNPDCNNSEQLFRKAQIEQFFHNIDRNWVMNNVPLMMDYEDFSIADYKALEAKYSEEGLRHDYIRITDCPCKNLYYDAEKEAVYIINPPSTKDDLRKENTGLQSRVGFTGKITAKISFPEMLNKHFVWNGITNAFWLIYHNESDWNLRKPCENAGYIPKHIIGEPDVRTRRNFYSEIDFEIVKASKHWPEYNYRNQTKFPKNDPDLLSDIIVTSTNWDLACLDPEKFIVGVGEIEFDGKTFYPHRWDKWYKASTTKYAVNHDDIFARDYYYYQIEWRPDCIIWRMGPEKDRMFTVGYLDSSVSSIPDNQMTFVVTQEYHHAEWWPTTEFKQQFIPYPAKPIIGKVLEVVIE